MTTDQQTASARANDLFRDSAALFAGVTVMRDGRVTSQTFPDHASLAQWFSRAAHASVRYVAGFDMARGGDRPVLEDTIRKVDPMPLSSTQRTANKLLDLETNARFWAQTGYKVGQKLDPKHNPTDAAMAKVWMDIFAKVKAEDKAGKLVVTYNRPEVKQKLADAASAQSVSIASVEAAAKAPDVQTAAQHAADAHEAQAAASAATATAAAYQPPTVSPEIAHHAATEAAIAANAPPPEPLALPASHAANSDRAKPAVQPVQLDEIANAADGRMPGDLPTYPNYQPPTSAAEQLALANATNAATKAADVHDIASKVPASAQTGSLPPATIQRIRDAAKSKAAADASPFVGLVLAPDGLTWTPNNFGSSAELSAWYGNMADAPESFLYLAAFDKAQGADPLFDMFGIGQSLIVPVHIEKETTTKSSYGPLAAVSAVALTGVAAVFAGRKKGKRA